MKPKPDLEAYYAMWPGNREGLLYSCRGLHRSTPCLRKK